MKLTVRIMRASYEYLVNTPPFSRWGLPLGQNVIFKITREKDVCGIYFPPGTFRPNIKRHVIAMVRGENKTSDLILATMAHEMIHLKREMDIGVDQCPHGAIFQRRADSVCRTHGFKRKSF